MPFTTSSAQGLEHVQPGETAFKTCVTFCWRSIRKSMTSVPFRVSINWARIPGLPKCENDSRPPAFPCSSAASVASRLDAPASM